MLTSQPYGSSSLTQGKIPLYIPCYDHNTNNTPIYEVYPRYTLFFWKICILFLALSLDLYNAIKKKKKKKTEKKATTHVVTMPKQSHQKAMRCLLLFVCLVTQCVQLFENPCTIAHQALLSMGFSMDRKYWSGLPFPSPGDLSDQGSNPNLQHWQLASLSPSHRGSHLFLVTIPVYCFLLSIHTQRPLVYFWSQEVLQLLLYYQ